jgi:hypothetical protein
MKERVASALRRFDLRRELGPAGLAALAVIAGALVFVVLVVQPLEMKSRALAERVSRLSPAAPGGAPESAAEKLGAFYRYLAKPEQTTDWLAKLYAIGHATGVELASASYRSETAGRIERYQIQLPVNGTYGQMREFLDRALAEIPVLSLDQITLKRETRRDGTVQAELRLTLHMVAKNPAERQVKPS